jgi:hypothetical protein
VIENTAGQGSNLGFRFEHLAGGDAVRFGTQIIAAGKGVAGIQTDADATLILNLV